MSVLNLCYILCALNTIEESINATCWTSLADWFCKIATVIIAAFNIFYAVKLDLFKNKKESEKEERDRKVSLLKTIIFDNTLSELYKFFKDLRNVLDKLKTQNADKTKIETELQSLFFAFGDSFTIYLKAADSNLGQRIGNLTDNLRDKLVEKIGDEGINLYVEHVFNDSIKAPYDEYRRQVIALLFGYRGNSDFKQVNNT